MDTRQMAWDMYFANLVAMQMHPGNRASLKDVPARDTIQACAHVADIMLIERSLRCQPLSEQQQAHLEHT